MQALRRNQFAITEAAAVGSDDGRVLRFQLCGRHAGARCGFGDEELPHLSGGVHDRRAAVLHGMAAGGIAFVRGQRRVGGDKRDAVEIDVELFRGDLHERSLDALAELGFAGEDRDRPVCVDADPGVEIRRLLKAAGERRRVHCRRRGRRRCIVLRQHLVNRCKAQHQRAGTGQHRAARDDGRSPHPLPPAFADSISAWARWMARRIRICVPQRHRCGSRKARMSAVAGARIFLQQRMRPHHDARNTVTALRRLLLDEGALDRGRAIGRAESLQRRDLLAGQECDWRDAGEHRFTVHQHSASAALAEAAAEFRRIEL